MTHHFRKRKMLTFFLLCILNIKAQDTVRGKIMDATTHQPLAYVQVGIISKQCGTLSDENGNFTLILRPKISSEDTIIFRLISYKTVYHKIENQKFLSIFMEPQLQELNEIVIKPKKIKHLTLGNKKYNKNINCYFSMENEGGSKKSGEAAIKANNKEGREVWLETFHFYLINNPKKDSLIFRLNFYTKNEKNYPDKIINKEPIVFKVPPGKTGIVDVDIKKFNIHVTGDFFIAVEVLSDFTNTDQPAFSGSVLGPVYIRKNAFSVWEKLPVMGLDFNVDAVYFK